MWSWRIYPIEIKPLELLREEVQKNQLFILKKTPFLFAQQDDKRLQGVTLKIYEYKSCGPPNPDASLRYETTPHKPIH